MRKRKMLLLIFAGAFLICAAVLFFYPVHQTQAAQQKEQAEIKAFSAYLEQQKVPQAPQESGISSIALCLALIFRLFLLFPHQKM